MQVSALSTRAIFRLKSYLLQKVIYTIDNIVVIKIVIEAFNVHYNNFQLIKFSSNVIKIYSVKSKGTEFMR
jgi:hypothetical protein